MKKAATPQINKKFFEDFIVPSYLVGENFGRLIVRDYIRKGSKKNPFSAVWLCECKCGGRIEASTAELRSRRIKDCGCDKGTKRTKEQVIFAMQMLKQEGNSVRQISIKTGVPKSTVDRWLKAA